MAYLVYYVLLVAYMYILQSVVLIKFDYLRSSWVIMFHCQFISQIGTCDFRIDSLSVIFWIIFTWCHVSRDDTIRHWWWYSCNVQFVHICTLTWLMYSAHKRTFTVCFGSFKILYLLFLLVLVILLFLPLPLKNQ